MTEHDFVFTMGRLWNCAEPLPDEYCNNLGLAPGSPYAEAARTINQTQVRRKQSQNLSFAGEIVFLTKVTGILRLRLRMTALFPSVEKFVRLVV